MHARIALVLTALLAVPVLAGCLTPPEPAPTAAATDAALPSEALYEALPPVSALTSMVDGVLLHSAVYLPDVPEGTKVPVIMDLSPYFGNSKPAAMLKGNGFSEWLVDHFVPRGYAVVLASVRGTGLSEGCWDHGGPAEQQDAYDLVEFYGTQDWSNGKVALIGKSYDGTTPLEAAVMHPPHLATIVPMAGLPHLYGYNYMNGVGYSIQGPLFNAYYPATVSVGPDQIADPDPMRLASRGCAELGVSIAEGVGTHMTGTYTDFWKARDYRPRIPEIDVPVFFIHGLQDFNVKPDMIHAYNTITAPKMAWFGQWFHDYPHRGDWNTTLLRWFDRWLKDLPNGLENDLAVEVSDSTGIWRREADWPPTRSTNLTLFLGEGTLLPENPEWSFTGFLSQPTTEPNPATDRFPNEAAYFLSEPLAAPVHLSGAPTVTLQIEVFRPQARVAATLFEVDSKGSWNWTDVGFLDLEHRDGLDTVQPVTPGLYNVTFQLYPQDTVFEAGHRIGFAVSSEANGWILPDGATPSQMNIHWGNDVPSLITLPVLTETTPMDPQPPMRERCDVEGNC